MTTHFRLNALVRLAALVAVLLVSTMAHAQEATPTPVPLDRSFSVQAFEPAVGQDSLFTIESARSPGHLTYTVGLILGYQNSPLSMIPCASGTGHPSPARLQPPCELDPDNATAIISHHLQADIIASFNIIDMIQIGLTVPVVLYQTGEDFEVFQNDQWIPQSLEGTTGMGDLRLHLKWTAPFGLARQANGFGLAIAPVITFPIGNAIVEDSFMGDGQVTVHAQVLGEYRRDHLQVAARLGYRWREDSLFLSTEMGQGLTYGVGASYAFPFGRYGHEVRPVVELFGSNGFSNELDQNTLELDVGAHLRLYHDFLIVAGAGFGLVRGVGSPAVRAFAGFVYSPKRFDRDRDGIPDREDDCANEAEDVDGYQDTDGCPEPDNDGDGVLDVDDRCPDDPEDADLFEDEDGCPELDDDGDGVEDGYDSCPQGSEDFDGYEDNDGCPDLDHDQDNIPVPRDHCPYEPEDTDGFGDLDGCPDPDFDGDGLDDEEELCPDQAEDFDGYQDDDGCPEPDNDSDGIPDAQDRCPDRGETWNARDDTDGCPDGGRSFVIFHEDRLENVYPIQFAGDTAEVTDARSTGTLDIVAAIMNARDTIRLRVQVLNANADLAQQRADAIRQYLIDHGVDGERIEATGLPGASSTVRFPIISDEPEFVAPPTDDMPEFQME